MSGEKNKRAKKKKNQARTLLSFLTTHTEQVIRSLGENCKLSVNKYKDCKDVYKGLQHMQRGQTPFSVALE